jgi:hypothetical protein
VRGGLTITIAGSSRSILRSWLPAPIDPFDIDFHQDLQHCLRYGSQEIAVAALLLRSTSPILSSVLGPRSAWDGVSQYHRGWCETPDMAVSPGGSRDLVMAGFIDEKDRREQLLLPDPSR